MITKVSRIILGIILVVFGLNGFLQFMPMGEMPEASIAFFTGLSAVKYFMPLLSLVKLFAGLLLLAKKWVPFALILIAPISVNIILYHIFAQPDTILPGLVVFALNFFLGYKYWNSYKSLFE